MAEYPNQEVWYPPEGCWFRLQNPYHDLCIYAGKGIDETGSVKQASYVQDSQLFTIAEEGQFLYNKIGQKLVAHTCNDDWIESWKSEHYPLSPYAK